LHLTSTQTRRGKVAVFDERVNERVFGLKPRERSGMTTELATILNRVGADANAVASFVAADVLTIDDARLVVSPDVIQPDALKLGVKPWAMLVRALHPPKSST
jgi:hypothetical protein